ncbi:hypothetical protein CBL_00995 [Carabus blaptoides fortunei]
MLEPIYTEQIDFPTNKACVSLKDQANSMQKFISSLQEQLTAKDQELVALKQERDQLVRDLRKHKKFYTTVRQQLEDERDFYMKEKEYFCKEITDSKKIRQQHTEHLKHMSDITEQVKELDIVRTELSKLKVYLNETLEANYNLSIKFLRMKNTKYSVQTRLRKMQAENARLVGDLQQKLDDTRVEMLHIISERFTQSLPPSNKKYLQVVKQNTQLVHENLTLNIELCNMVNNIERIKADSVKLETQLRLKYARHAELTPPTTTTTTTTSVATVDKMCDAHLCDQLHKNKTLISENTLFSLLHTDITPPEMSCTKPTQQINDNT